MVVFAGDRGEEKGGDEMWWHQLEQEVRATGHRRHAVEMFLRGTMV